MVWEGHKCGVRVNNCFALSFLRGLCSVLSCCAPASQCTPPNLPFLKAQHAVPPLPALRGAIRRYGFDSWLDKLLSVYLGKLKFILNFIKYKKITMMKMTHLITIKHNIWSCLPFLSGCFHWGVNWTSKQGIRVLEFVFPLFKILFIF